MLYDTHCHLYKEYYDDIDSIIKKAKDNGVEKYISDATNINTCYEMLELANKYEDIYITLGIHPECIDESYDDANFNYRINTNLCSSTSLMIAGAMLIFEFIEGINNKYILTIQNISEFVYGYVDMSEKYGWDRPLWKTYQPSKNAKLLESSIMHYSKN